MLPCNIIYQGNLINDLPVHDYIYIYIYIYLSIYIYLHTYIMIPNGSYLVDPASSHMLVSKIKPCMSKYKQFVL
jgi:hypothetical protein